MISVRAAEPSTDRQALVSAAFDAYYAGLLAFLRRSTRDDAAAEDLVQEAFLRLTREVDAGRVPEHVRAWLYRVAANLATSRARRRRTVIAWVGRYGRQVLEATTGSPDADVIAGEGLSALERAMATLSPDARLGLTMSAEGFDGQEIAAAIGRTNMATRTMLSRARHRVRLQLEGA